MDTKREGRIFGLLSIALALFCFAAYYRWPKMPPIILDICLILSVIFALIAIYLVIPSNYTNLIILPLRRLGKMWLFIGMLISAAAFILFATAYFGDSSKSNAFSIKISMWFGSKNDPRGLWVLRTNKKSENIVVQADLAVFLEIVNLQPFLSQISAYKIQVKIVDNWVNTKRIDARIGEIFFVPSKGNFHQAYRLKPETFFDHNISERNIQQKETIRGWVLLKFIDRTISSAMIHPTKGEFRVILVDSTGTSFDSGTIICKSKLTNEDAQSANLLNKQLPPIDLGLFKKEDVLEN